jgi:hypothetical protein
MRHNDP